MLESSVELFIDADNLPSNNSLVVEKSRDRSDP